MRAARVLPRLALLACLWLASGAAATCLAQATAGPTDPEDGVRVLTNGDVVQMLRSGFSDGAVIAVIQKANTQFDLGSASLAELRYAGVSSAVIVAMLEAGNRPPVAPATPPAPAPEPAPEPAGANEPEPSLEVETPHEPETPTPPAFEREYDRDRGTPRGGGVFGLSFGGHYAWVIDEENDPSSDEVENRFGASVGLLAGGQVGGGVTILADLHASLWPETNEYEEGVLFSLGPAVRFSPVSHLFLQAGIGFALATQPRDAYDDDTWDTWIGPAGHLGVGVELTNGRSPFALELLTRLDLAALSEYDCEDCGTTILGRATGQLALTWY